MPVRESIGANRISEINLVPHLRGGRKGGAAIAVATEADGFVATAGVEIEQWDLVGYSDGVLVKADAVAGVAAVGVAAEAAVAGESVRVRISMFVPSPDAIAGAEYWLGVGGLSATVLPTNWKVLQRIGIGVSGGVIYDIGEIALLC
ncbi:MAG TPA: hypothetical protein PLU67_02675 [Candidatus Kapabacteria bacterium]|nr:hypothetical protein [Candidatus Kapabacteria bacterium]HOM04379.1 hypothetical protein [Candidatus Kapabacteria bacterium]HPP38687.1 hypothetical protein [Candidatus Kapabacteria bacterium]